MLDFRLCPAIIVLVFALAFQPGGFATENTDSIRVPAFPGAEGGGAFTVGGRGGKVMVVSTLADRGPGSFRAALEATGPRIVIFNISGTINLKTPISISSPNITIAGQTAPGDGVCIAGSHIELNAQQIVVRYLRFRRGDHGDDDSIKGNSHGGIIIDHCSFSWATNDNLCLHRSTIKDEFGFVPIRNITLQWSIISEALMSRHNGRGSIFGGENASFHHNLLACNSKSNTSLLQNNSVDFRNNVIFNWLSETVTGGYGPGKINIIGNYFKPGPATSSDAILIATPQKRFWNEEKGEVWARWYVADNFVEGHEGISSDNWLAVKSTEAGAQQSEYRTDAPFTSAKVTTHSAKEAYGLVLERAGAVLPVRDAVDARVVEMVRTGQPSFKQGIINTPDDVGGYPAYGQAKPHRDSDGDGMPDWWETKYGLDSNDAADANGDLNGSGYTNIEEFLNGTDPKAFVDYSIHANNVNTLSADSFKPPHKDSREPK